MEFYQRPLSVKDLSFTEFNFFGQVSYPFTPLLSGSLATLLFPKIRGYYIGPAFTYSLADNLEFSIFVQLFSGRFPDTTGDPERQTFTLGFMRFKYNF
jgi:hypothetical protein